MWEAVLLRAHESSGLSHMGAASTKAPVDVVARNSSTSALIGAGVGEVAVEPGDARGDTRCLGRLEMGRIDSLSPPLSPPSENPGVNPGFPAVNRNLPVLYRGRGTPTRTGVKPG